MINNVFRFSQRKKEKEKEREREEGEGAGSGSPAPAPGRAYGGRAGYSGAADEEGGTGSRFGAAGQSRRFSTYVSITNKSE